MHSFPMIIRTPKIILDAFQSPFIELSEKQLLQAPDADATFLDGAAVVYASSWNNTKFSGTVFGS